MSESSEPRARLWVVGLALLVLFGVPGVDVTVGDWMAQGRGAWPRNQAAAEASMRSLLAAQALFRASDADRDGVEDFGSIAELASAALGDEMLGSGTKIGYTFEVVAAEDRWLVVAAPLTCGTSGERSYAVDHEGVVRSSTKPIPLSESRAIPAGLEPVEG